MSTTLVIGISFSKELLEKIDAQRGDISRSRYVMRALEKVYGINNGRKEKEMANNNVK